MPKDIQMLVKFKSSGHVCLCFLFIRTPCTNHFVVQRKTYKDGHTKCRYVQIPLTFCHTPQASTFSSTPLPVEHLRLARKLELLFSVAILCRDAMLQLSKLSTSGLR